jgi:hypothetical protein
MASRFSAPRSEMEILNASVAKPQNPTGTELSSDLGAGTGIGDRLVDWLAREQGVAIREQEYI